MDNEKPVGASCALCRYSMLQRSPPPALQSVLSCRRFPPTTTAIPTAQGLMMQTQFPIVNESMYCAEYVHGVDTANH